MATEKNLRQDFTGRLVAFVGKEFWQFWAGGAGSIVSFDAGRKVRIYDPRFRRKYEGELSVLLLGAAWRIDSEDKGIACSSSDSNAKGSAMQRGLKSILHHRIQSMSFLNTALDLEIKFQGHRSLTIFCNQTEELYSIENYSVFFTDVIYTVTQKSHIRRESRQVFNNQEPRLGRG